MKIIKPVINQKCSSENCKEKATCRLFSKNYCRLHRIKTLNSWREKRNKNKEGLQIVKCAKCSRKIEKEFANFYQNENYCLVCIKEIGGLK